MDALDTARTYMKEADKVGVLTDDGQKLVAAAQAAATVAQAEYAAVAINAEFGPKDAVHLEYVTP